MTAPLCDTSLAITYNDIIAARAAIKGCAVETPLLESQDLNRRTGGRIFLKAECLQIAGSFKFRGAYNRIANLSEDAVKRGVVGWSSGNHAQGLAAAAQMRGSPAKIVMPSDAPGVKIENTKALGGDVVLYNRQTESREEIGRALATELGATLVPSYDDPFIIAGQGTTGAEICDVAASRGAALDAVLVCCGGGGLTAGISVAVAALSPRTAVHTVEPAHYDDTARSLVAGERRANASDAPPSLCDALLAPTPGSLTFPILKKNVRSGLVVSEDEVGEAIRYAFTKLNLVLEPGGAVALAAVLSGKIDTTGKNIAVVLSGGNIDPALFASIIHPKTEEIR